MMSGSNWRKHSFKDSNFTGGSPTGNFNSNIISDGVDGGDAGGGDDSKGRSRQTAPESFQSPKTPPRDTRNSHVKGKHDRVCGHGAQSTKGKFSPKRSSNKKINANRQHSLVVKATEKLSKSISIFHAEKQGLVEIASERKTSATSNDSDNDNDDGGRDLIPLVWNVQQDVHTAATELSVILSDTKAAVKDARVHEAYSMIFQGADCIEQYLLSNNISLGVASEEQKKSIQYSIMVWDDIAKLISSSLLNQHDLKYTPRKASKVKFPIEKVHTMFSIVLRPIASLLDVEWSPKGDRNSPNSELISPKHIAPFLFGIERHCEKMVVLLRCLRDFVMGFGYNMDSNQHIIPLVERIIDPILAFDPKAISNERRGAVSIHDVLSIHTATVELLVRILRWKQCSSALLAPLVIDVNTRGIEQLKANPLRERLLSSVITIINCDVYLRLDDTSWLCHTCQCLASLLDNMNAAKGAKKQATGRNTSDQIQIANIFKWVHKTLQCDIVSFQNERSLWWYSLDLLKTVIRLYPESCAQYWSLFLPQYSTSSSSSSSQSESPRSPRDKNCQAASGKKDLMSIICLHDDSGISLREEQIMAVLCCKEIIEALPLHLWSRSGYLMRRVETSLGVVITTTTRYISQSNPSRERESFYSLAVTILTAIPFHEYDQLVKPAVDLINLMGRFYNMYGLHGGLGLEETVRALTDCFGGKENPDGEVTPLPIPVRDWLKRSISSTFISRLFNKMSDISSHEVIEKGVQTLMQMNLFVQVVRSAHWILGDQHSTRMKSFLSLTRMLLQSDDSSLKVTGCELLVAFIEGGKSTAGQDSHQKDVDIQLPLTLYADLYSTLSEEQSGVLCSALSAYSSLNCTVWMELLVSEYNPLTQILPMALEYSGHPKGKVRSEACCALGNIMSVLVRGSSCRQWSSSVQDLITLNIEGTLQVTASATEDSDANVRSMAMFAIGNVALDTVESKKLSLLKRISFMKLCDATYNKLFDDNEKVINNAIRTSGHLFKLANFHPHDNFSLLSRCSQFLAAFGSKIDRAILDVTNVSENRSWKHRLNAKKQAWGACQAFDPILLFAAKEGGVDRESIRDAVLHLINCVENSDQINKKITISAVNSLNNIQTVTWKQLSAYNGMQGRCLAACLAKVESNTLPKSVKDQLQGIVGNLLHDISDKDIFACLNHNDISQEHIHYLYGWMVIENIESNLFESFGRVMLHHPSIQMDVSLAQRFQSRATYAARKRRLRGANEDELECFDEDSDEDEL